MVIVEEAPGRVERQRLLDRFDADVGAGTQIIALSAPPGAGKSTVLQQWRAARRAAGEVVVAVAGSRSENRSDLWPDFRASIPSAVAEDQAAELTAFLGHVLHSHAPEPAQWTPGRPVPLWILLDDAQAWTDPRVIAQLGRLLAATSPGLRIAIAARYTVHGLLSAALLEGRVAEYRSADLAFDEHEARALFAAQGVDLADAELQTLLKRTDGWVAGLRLAVLALGRRPDHAAFVANFTGTERSVSDYLISAVLSGLPAEHLDVLLDVSVADRVNLDLARLLTGRPAAGRLLHELAESNALVSTLNNQPDWYELHPLLRSHLRAAARMRDDVRYARGQQIVVDWFESSGDGRQAIQHAAAAGSWERVEDLTDAHCVPVLAVEGPLAMHDIVRSLPAWLQARPAVAGAAALTTALEGHPAAAELELAVLDAAGEDPSRRLAIRSIVDLANGAKGPRDRDRLHDALAALDEATGTDPDLTILGRALAGTALAMAGDLAAADRAARSAVELSRARGRSYFLFRSLLSLCDVCSIRSDVDGVRTAAAEAIELAAAQGWECDARLAPTYAQLALAQWQVCDEATAQTYARLAVEVADVDTDPVSSGAAQCLDDVITSRTQTGLDLIALEHLYAFHEVWPKLARPVAAQYACFELTVALRHREAELSGAILRTAEEVLAGTADLQVLRALRHSRQGHEIAARQDLQPVLTSTATFLTPWTGVVGWALGAHLADSAGEPARTHDALLAALQLAEQGHCVRGLLDVAPTIRTLLRRHLGRFGRYDGFVAEILAMEDRWARSGTGTRGTGLILTEKELTVLRDLPSMLSVREIADAHVVSINTVKTHMKSVYRKLGAASRREAVEMAREVGLI